MKNSKKSFDENSPKSSGPREYEGHLRQQEFVERWERNPFYNPADNASPRDNRRYRESTQWLFVRRRMVDYWRSQGEHRAPPSGMKNDAGVEGWWFPQHWSIEYRVRVKDGSLGQVQKPMMVDPDRVHRMERMIAQLRFLNTFPTDAEFRSWRCPPGTQFVARDQTVVYPDGTYETWSECRQRAKGEYSDVLMDRTDERDANGAPMVGEKFRKIAAEARAKGYTSAYRGWPNRADPQARPSSSANPVADTPPDTRT